jgi:glycerol-3-phosphate dehydrogenase
MKIFEDLRSYARQEVPQDVSPRTLDAWLRNHGTQYRALAELAGSPDEARRLGASDTATAEVTYAVREEMAVHLQDVVLRRTDLGSGSHPGSAALRDTARRMQQLMGWTDLQCSEEVAQTEAVLRHHHASVPGTTASTTGQLE